MTFKQRTIEVRHGLLVEDGKCQTRAGGLNDDHVAELCGAYKLDPAGVPPIKVFDVGGGNLVVVDGYHRKEAARLLRLERVRVTIVGEGDYDDARAAAFGVNRGHGLKRTNADKRREVALALAHPYAADWSHADIAERCDVGVNLVREVRDEMKSPSRAQATHGAAAPKAEDVARANPDASVREVAKAAGVSKSVAARAKQQVSQGSERISGTPKKRNENAESVSGEGPKPFVREYPAADAYKAMAAEFRSFRQKVAPCVAALPEGRRQHMEDALTKLLREIQYGLPAEAAE